jgi:hypothetical protein
MIAATTTADEKIAKELGKPTYTIEELNVESGARKRTKTPTTFLSR